MGDLPTTFDSMISSDPHRSIRSAVLTSFIEPVHIAVIGGTGLGQLEGFEPIAVLNPITPWGAPASPIHILSHKGVNVAFLARHGIHHEFAPHEVPNRANIAALRHIGVRCVIAFSAVGSLQEEIKPMDFVVPDQVIDRTKGVRPFTFFEGGVVGHVGFADPFDAGLAKVVKTCAEHMEGDGVVLHEKGTVIVMEGPQFSTRAESHMYRSWGGSVINMSTLPEAKLAREAEMAYQVIAMATDYDCWHSFEDVNVEMVGKYMKANSQNAKRLVGAVLDRLADLDNSDLVLAKHWQGASQGAVKFMTKPEGRNPEAMKKVEYLFPGFWEE
ncbi:5 -methylthioadenosine phosphorylase [Fusarium albosuccineum]|uniref:S-methyl-5'-thioadenosine phosphorylase n=1 Tax=Fusarium albosuccineum TaxID=1237068 RepID=A0A8H4PKU7_9HYPO|nr:5 -methylthioadenosine phosphorylase [Fusarium albosuccineum]